MIVCTWAYMYMRVHSGDIILVFCAHAHRTRTISCHQVVEGNEVLDLIEAAGADNMDGKPTVPVVIVGCGVLE